MSPDLCPCRLTRPHPACQLTAVPHNFSLPLAKASVAGLQAKIKTGALLEGPALLTGAPEGTGPHPRESRGFGVCGPQDGWAVGAGPGIRLLWAGWRGWSPLGPLWAGSFGTPRFSGPPRSHLENGASLVRVRGSACPPGEEEMSSCVGRGLRN